MKTVINLGSIAILLVVFSANAQTNLNNSVAQIQTETTESFKGIRYNFYPNLEAYFDNKTSEFIFKVNGEWIKDKSIPNDYRGYSVYNNYNVPITDYFGEKPFENLAENKKTFPYYSNDRKGKLAAMQAQKKAELKEKGLVMN
ncbi:hypothetical protein OX283_013110 [Flavobacterium sp. SUN052]|uniref:hypothetical protein n=1 Tax=Flavobacterium sp. SUN052 TaxID=3002441 RepID=UPI00237ED975|nr:hypothetical protein [Flavobacterium sp. SUN052]MEC4005603.1 hypothetical protein [Flavobacterium sp. SUN052]